MTSTAISAQGTKLFIETGAGVAKNITGIAPGNPTIITIAGHGIPNGNVSALSGIVGTIGAALNAKSLVVTNVTPDTFAVQVDTTGLAYGNGASRRRLPIRGYPTSKALMASMVPVRKSM